MFSLHSSARDQKLLADRSSCKLHSSSCQTEKVTFNYGLRIASASVHHLRPKWTLACKRTYFPPLKVLASPYQFLNFIPRRTCTLLITSELLMNRKVRRHHIDLERLKKLYESAWLNAYALLALSWPFPLVNTCLYSLRHLICCNHQVTWWK